MPTWVDCEAHGRCEVTAVAGCSAPIFAHSVCCHSPCHGCVHSNTLLGAGVYVRCPVLRNLEVLIATARSLAVEASTLQEHREGNR